MDTFSLFCIKVDVADDHMMPVGLPNMWTVFKIIDRVSGNPVAGPDLQVQILNIWQPRIYILY